MSELCAAFGISRKTGYKWLQRYAAEGPSGLADRSRAPHDHGRRMAPEVSAAILALRRDRPQPGHKGAVTRAHADCAPGSCPG